MSEKSGTAIRSETTVGEPAAGGRWAAVQALAAVAGIAAGLASVLGLGWSGRSGVVQHHAGRRGRPVRRRHLPVRLAVQRRREPWH